MVLSSNQKGEWWQKTEKAQDNLSPIFTLCRFRSLREILIVAGWRSKIISWEKVKIKESTLLLCVYKYTHIYKYNLWMKWWSPFLHFDLGKPAPEILSEDADVSCC